MKTLDRWKMQAGLRWTGARRWWRELNPRAKRVLAFGAGVVAGLWVVWLAVWFWNPFAGVLGGYLLGECGWRFFAAAYDTLQPATPEHLELCAREEQIVAKELGRLSPFARPRGARGVS